MPDLGTAITGGISLIGSSMESDAAGDAADAQAASAAAGIAEQRRQFDAMQALLKPYQEAGLPALTQQQAFLGLGGAGAEQAAIDRIRGGAQYGEMVRQGEEALLQRASATGGLRGGNIQAALAQFRPQVLNQLIEQQYGRLGGMTALGQQSAAGVGSAGMQTGTNIANLLANQGAAQAGGILGESKAWGQGISSLGNIAGQYFGRQQPSSGFGGYLGTTPGSAQNATLMAQDAAFWGM